MVTANTNNTEILLIGLNGDKLGIKTLEEANRLAAEEGYDLKCCSKPDAKMQVFRIADLGKEKYLKKKQQKVSKAKQRCSEVKTVQISPTIGENEKDRKLLQAREFLTKGNTVRIEMLFKGRIFYHPEIGERKMAESIASLQDISSVKSREMAGRFLIVYLKPKS